MLKRISPAITVPHWGPCAWGGRSMSSWKRKKATSPASEQTAWEVTTSSGNGTSRAGMASKKAGKRIRYLLFHGQQVSFDQPELTCDAGAVVIIPALDHLAVLHPHDRTVSHFHPATGGREIPEARMKVSGLGAAVEELDNRPAVGAIATGDDVDDLDLSIRESGAPALIVHSVAVGTDLCLVTRHSLAPAVRRDDGSTTVGIAQVPGFVKPPDGLFDNVH